MAVLCAETDQRCREKTVSRLVKDMQSADETRKHVGLLVVGELGRQADLSAIKDLQVRKSRRTPAHGVHFQPSPLLAHVFFRSDDAARWDPPDPALPLPPLGAALFGAC